MEVERAGTFVEIAGEVVQVNPAAARDRLRRVTDAHAELDDGFVRRNVADGDLMSVSDLLAGGQLSVFSARQFNNTRRRVINQRGDVVLGLNLERAWFHRGLFNRKERREHNGFRCDKAQRLAEASSMKRVGISVKAGGRCDCLIKPCSD